VLPVFIQGARSFTVLPFNQRNEVSAYSSDCINRPKFVIGGDHSIAMGTVSGVAAHFRNRDEEMGLIWFDAHGDMNIPGVSPSGNIHGMPLAHLLGRGDPDLAGILGFSPKLNPDKVVLIGIRDIDASERRIIHESGIHVFTMRDIDEHGMAKVARKAILICLEYLASTQS